MPALAASDWDISGEHDITYNLGSSPYKHHYTIIQDASDNLDGTGYYVPNNSYTEDITYGSVDDNKITLNIIYTGLNAGYTLKLEGIIDTDGSVKGTADSSTGQEFTWSWPAGSVIDTDTDNDGIINEDDVLCPKTEDDSLKGWSEMTWGTNRWQYMYDNSKGWGWYQNKPVKGTPQATYRNDLGYTCGCSGHEILSLLTKKFDDVMKGHYKFGPSSSVVEEFSKDCPDGKIDGRYLIDTITVPAKGDKVPSHISLDSGKTYTFEASGTCNWRTPGSAGGYLADAEYWLRHDAYGEGWTHMGIWSLAMWNGAPVDVEWGALYSVNNKYSYEYMPSTTGLVTFFFNDDQYGDNSGNLTVNIYAEL